MSGEILLRMVEVDEAGSLSTARTHTREGIWEWVLYISGHRTTQGEVAGFPPIQFFALLQLDDAMGKCANSAV